MLEKTGQNIARYLFHLGITAQQSSDPFDAAGMEDFAPAPLKRCDHT